MFRLILTLTISFCYCVINIAQTSVKSSYETINAKIAAAQEANDFEQALILAKIGQEKAQAEFSTEDSTYASYQHQLGLLSQVLGQYKKAEEAYIIAQKSYAASIGTAQPDYAAVLNQLGHLYYLMAKFDLAKSFYIDAKQAYIEAAATQTAGYASTLCNLGLLYKKTKHFDLAEPLYLESKDIFSKIYSNTHSEYLAVNSQLAWLYASNSQYKLAEKLLLESRQNIILSLGKEHPSYLLNLHTLSSLYTRMASNKKAEVLFLEAKRIYEKQGDTRSSNYSSLLNNLGMLYINTRQFKKAETLFLESEQISEANPNLDRPLFVSFLKNFAFIYLKLNRPDLALQKLQKGLYFSSGLELSTQVTQSWADSILNVEHASTRHLQKTMEVLKTFANCLAYQKESKKELLVCHLATQLIEKKQKDLLSSKDKLRWLSRNVHWFFRSLEILNPDNDASQAFHLAEQNKSILLLNASKSEKKYRLGNLPDSLILKEKTLLHKRDQLKAKLMEQRSKKEKDNLRAVLIEVNQEMESFRSQIKQHYPKYAHSKYEKNDVTAPEIQSLLDDQTAIIEYVVTRSMVHIFYVDKNKVAWIKKDMPAQVLNKKIDSLHHLLSNYKALSKNPKSSFKSFTKLSHWFYQELIAPSLNNAPSSIKNLIFIPDSKLGHLPFETFLVEGSTQETAIDYTTLHYLINDYNISYNFSAALWKENLQGAKPTNNGSILAIAAAYDSIVNPSRLPIHQKIRKSLANLPAAQEEIAVLEQNFAGSFLYGAEASEKAFKEQAGNFAVIHLAMHGILDRKHPILSSLAFSENNDSLENNFLQAHEISKLKLNSDLIVLSACETGYGQFEQGNGIASLARAFMYAGSYSLLVSLWQVNDYSTSEIMQLFYKNLSKGMDKAEALRTAKLFFIQNTEGFVAHPAFWSPFIQIGNTEAIYIQPRSQFSYLWGLGLLTLIGAAGVFWSRRKKLV